MHDLDELRRRLWLAVVFGVVGCETGAATSTDPPKTIAPDAEETNVESGRVEAKPAPEVAGSGGMSSVVKGAVSKAAANTEAKKEIAAAERAAFATATCTVVVELPTAAKGATGALEHGCPLRSGGGMQLEVEPTATLRKAGDDDNCCYRESRRVVRGRPYTVDGAPRLPSFQVCPAEAPLALRTGARRRAAAGWLHDAREELASVAAFERAALELALVGAPRHLIDACSVAATQEHRHATLCLSIAEEFAVRPLHLGPPLAVEPRRVGLLALLTETFEAGCVGESIAAALAGRGARWASDRIRPALVEIAADETEHAALAWSTVAWGVPRLTADERAMFFAAATAARVADPPTWAPRDGSANVDLVYGRLSPALQAEVAAEVWMHVIMPLLHETQRRPEFADYRLLKPPPGLR